MECKDTDRKAASQKPVAKCHQMPPEEKEVLFNKYIVPNMASVKSLVRRYTDHYQDVDENYNHCLAQLFHYINTYNEEQKLDTWIHICVKRACFHQNQKRAEEASHWTDIEFCTSEDLHQHGTSMLVDAGFGSLLDNLSDAVRNALSAIPAARLSPFLLYAQGYSLREITALEWERGHLERKSEDLVRSRIYWAKAQLQLTLRKNGIRR